MSFVENLSMMSAALCLLLASCGVQEKSVVSTGMPVALPNTVVGGAGESGAGAGGVGLGDQAGGGESSGDAGASMTNPGGAESSNSASEGESMGGGESFGGTGASTSSPGGAGSSGSMGTESGSGNQAGGGESSGGTGGNQAGSGESFGGTGTSATNPGGAGFGGESMGGESGSGLQAGGGESSGGTGGNQAGGGESSGGTGASTSSPGGVGSSDSGSEGESAGGSEAGLGGESIGTESGSGNQAGGGESSGGTGASATNPGGVGSSDSGSEGESAGGSEAGAKNPSESSGSIIPNESQNPADKHGSDADGAEHSTLGTLEYLKANVELEYLKFTPEIPLHFDAAGDLIYASRVVPLAEMKRKDGFLFYDDLVLHNDAVELAFSTFGVAGNRPFVAGAEEYAAVGPRDVTFTGAAFARVKEDAESRDFIGRADLKITGVLHDLSLKFAGFGTVQLLENVEKQKAKSFKFVPEVGDAVFLTQRGYDAKFYGAGGVADEVVGSLEFYSPSAEAVVVFGAKR